VLGLGKESMAQFTVIAGLGIIVVDSKRMDGEASKSHLP
jgi:hypothetical protein